MDTTSTDTTMSASSSSSVPVDTTTSNSDSIDIPPVDPVRINEIKDIIRQHTNEPILIAGDIVLPPTWSVDTHTSRDICKPRHKHDDFTFITHRIQPDGDVNYQIEDGLGETCWFTTEQANHYPHVLSSFRVCAPHAYQQL
eukprot:TRINITY_DN10949_c1_g1_i1.p2 TRINITY_DN10949_c1_g1~~TRINITY_DN10949_c1_g1_i1.p2  ORF type:complete len:141 (-),score=30.92 TRINITY_DN10949_c1_g1_i1:233-655(-)